MNPRHAALDILCRLEDSPQRLEKLLHQHLGQKAPERDRALATNLVYTVLRNRLYLDHLLRPCLKRPLEKLDQPLPHILRLGAAELMLLNTPDHAAVDGAVRLTIAGPAQRARGLVNGVLRTLARRRQTPPPPPKGRAARLSIQYSHPRWLVEELLQQLPPDQVEALLAANQEQPPLALRANTLKIEPPELARRLAPLVGPVEPHPLDRDSLVLRGFSGRANHLPGFEQGLFQVQDPGATAVTRLLQVRPGQRVLDLCAGAGGKTGHLAALMQNQGELVAVEPSPGRVRGLETNLERLGVRNARIIQADATRLGQDLGTFDRILVDAPCTGLGVVGRRPDLRWRRRPQDAERLARLQLELLRAALRLLAPGGLLLYCTCTITRRENQAVIQELMAKEPGLELQWPPDTPLQADGYFHTYPHQHHCDGFFAAAIMNDES